MIEINTHPQDCSILSISLNGFSIHAKLTKAHFIENKKKFPKQNKGTKLSRFVFFSAETRQWDSVNLQIKTINVYAKKKKSHTRKTNFKCIHQSKLKVSETRLVPKIQDFSFSGNAIIA